MNYKIVSDSSSDIFALENVNYASVPLKIITDEKEYIDTPDLDVNGMIDDLRKYKGASKSSCPNMDDWTRSFGDADAIFCVTITKNLSGSFNSATLATEDLIEEHPEKKAFVVDTLTAGPECALIVDKLASLVKEDKSFENICAEIREYQRSTHLLFCLESLRNLANNGRVSHAVAKVAGVLGIRVVGKASDEGTLEIESKVRGADKAIAEIYKKMQEYGYKGGRVAIHHCRNLEGALNLKAIIEADFPGCDVVIRETGALCSFYAESGGFLVGYEGDNKY